MTAARSRSLRHAFRWTDADGAKHYIGKVQHDCLRWLVEHESSKGMVLDDTIRRAMGLLCDVGLAVEMWPDRWRAALVAPVVFVALVPNNQDRRVWRTSPYRYDNTKRPLGEEQFDMLRSLCAHGMWTRGSAWPCTLTASRVEKLLDGLIRRHLVEQAGIMVWRPTLAGRRAVGRIKSQLAAQETPP